MSKKSVLYVIPGAGRGSSFIFSQREGQALRDRGLGVDIHYLDTTLGLRNLLRQYRSLKETIRAVEPQLIHVQYGTISAFVSCLAAGSIPFLISFRGGDLMRNPEMSWIRSSVAHFLSHAATTRSSFNICVSRELQDRLLFGKKRSVVLPTGVDTKLFVPMDRGQARKRLGWDARGRVVLFNLSSSHQLKRLDLAEAGIEELRRRHIPAELVVLRGDVEPSRVPLYMNASDCLLLTSDVEGSPTVVQEALCCNLPIVSVDVGDVRERVAGVEPGRIVERDAVSIAEGLRGVLAESRRSNGIVKRDEISLENLTARIVEVYEQVLSGR